MSHDLLSPLTTPETPDTAATGAPGEPPATTPVGPGAGSADANLMPPDLAALVDGRPEDVQIKVESGFHDWARGVARRSGAAEPVTSTLEALQANADDAARRLAAARVDPDNNMADAIARERYEDAILFEGALRERVDTAKTEMADRQAELRQLGGEPAPPDPRTVTIWGTLAAAAPVGLALYIGVFADLAPTATLASLGAAGVALLTGGLVTSGLVKSAAVDTPEDRRVHGAWLVVSGLVATGTWLLAASAATDAGSHLQAIGLAVGEIASVLIVELFALGLAASWRRYRDAIGPWRAAAGRVDDATTALAECTRELTDCRQAQEAYVAAVRRREHFARSAEFIRKSAHSAVNAGYHAGIEENRGYLFGNAVRPPTARELHALNATGLDEDSPTH